MTNEHEIFATVKSYNSYPIIKISSQLDHRNYSFELITEKHRSKATTKTLY